MGFRGSVTKSSLVVAGALIVGSVVAVSADEARQSADAAAQAVPFDSGLGVYEPRDTQCVLFDTRDTVEPDAEKLAANTARTFSLDGGANVGGESDCVVSVEAIGAHVNLVGMLPDNRGNLKIWPASEFEPNGGIVNFSPQQPNLNNSNAVNLVRDDAGWTVRSNGGPVHVRAILYGHFFDAGHTFAATDHNHDGAYASLGHDHMLTQDVGATTVIPDTGDVTVSSVDLTLPEQCPAGSTEVHAVRVDYSGTLEENLLLTDPGVEVTLTLFLDGNPIAASALPVQVPPDIDGSLPVARTWALQDVAPGAHTIEVHAERDGGLLDGSVSATITTVVEARGFTC